VWGTSTATVPSFSFTVSLSVVPTTGRLATSEKVTAVGLGVHTTIAGAEDRKVGFTLVPR
jgi:hypothetical protein